MDGDRAEVLVNARFLTQTVTGVQRYARELVRALDGLADSGGIEYGERTLALLAPKDAYGEDLGLKRVTISRVGFLKGTAWGQLELPYHARGKLLWSPTNTGPVYHQPHAVTIHDVAVLDHPEWFSTAFATWYRYMLPKLAKSAARLFTVSEFSRRRLVEVLDLDPERVHVVPNGVDARFKPVRRDAVDRVRGKLGLPRSYVLALSSLEPRKNLARLLEAWSLLVAKRLVDERTHLVVAGGKASSFREAKLPLPDRVILTGYVMDDDLPALYSGASAFVYPSVYEGFGLPPLEAMSCGVPTVTSASTSLPEVVGNAALLVDPLQTETIVEKLRLVLNDAALAGSLRSAGRARAGAFTWSMSARTLWAHLSGAAGS